MSIPLAADSSLAELHSRMQCFSLSFGGIGFLVHLLGLWNTLTTSSNLSPWKMEAPTHARRNLTLSICGLLGSISVVIYNIVQCRSSTALVLLSVYKGIFSTLANVMSIGSSWRNLKKERISDLFIGSIAMGYSILGFGVGVSGMGMLVRQGWDDSRMQIVVGLTIFLFITGTYGMRNWIGREEDSTIADSLTEWFMSTVLTACFVGGLASEWVLAIAADNLGGAPVGKDNEFVAVYVTYVVATLVSFANS